MNWTEHTLARGKVKNISKTLRQHSIKNPHNVPCNTDHRNVQKHKTCKSLQHVQLSNSSNQKQNCTVLCITRMHNGTQSVFLSACCDLVLHSIYNTQTLLSDIFLKKIHRHNSPLMSPQQGVQHAAFPRLNSYVTKRAICRKDYCDYSTEPHE